VNFKWVIVEGFFGRCGGRVGFGRLRKVEGLGELI
jgi:hypothetical protein